jgi:stringent starvation protein B
MVRGQRPDPLPDRRVDARTQVPQGYVKDGQIVLNVGPSAVRNIQMDNDWVTFSARFGGASHAIQVPVGNVLAIYAKETGEGMSFEHLLSDADEDATASIDAAKALRPARKAKMSRRRPSPPRASPGCGSSSNIGPSSPYVVHAGIAQLVEQSPCKR